MTILQPSRRRFLFGASAFLAAPAIVRVASIMPVSVLPIAPMECSFAEIAARVLATIWADPARNAIWKQLETANILREQRERANFARAA